MSLLMLTAVSISGVFVDVRREDRWTVLKISWLEFSFFMNVDGMTSRI